MFSKLDVVVVAGKTKWRNKKETWAWFKRNFTVQSFEVFWLAIQYFPANQRKIILSLLIGWKGWASNQNAKKFTQNFPLKEKQILFTFKNFQDLTWN